MERPDRHFPADFLLGLALLAAACCTACAPERNASAVPDASRPDLQKVLVEGDGGRDRFATAAVDYRAYLAHHPEDAEAHLEMGILLHDALSQSAEAIFHFETFLAACPNSEKADIARDYIEQANKRLSASAARAEAVRVPATSAEELTTHIESLNRQIAAIRSECGSLSNQVDKLERDNASLVSDVSSLRKKLAIIREGGDIAPPRPRSVPELKSHTIAAPRTSPTATPASSPANRRGTYQVKRGDTLWSIAQLMYGDASRNTDIRKANPGKIGPNDSLTEGDVLVIP